MPWTVARRVLGWASAHPSLHVYSKLALFFVTSLVRWGLGSPPGPTCSPRRWLSKFWLPNDLSLALLVRGNVPRKPGEITGRLGILPLSWGSARLIAYCLSRCNLRL